MEREFTTEEPVRVIESEWLRRETPWLIGKVGVVKAVRDSSVAVKMDDGGEFAILRSGEVTHYYQ